MERKWIILLLGTLVLLLVCVACGPAAVKPEETPAEPSKLPVLSPRPEGDKPVAGEPAAGQELMCLADSREEAQRIADLYEIELVSWEEHVAVFHTEEDPNEVIRRGEANDWPRLDINHVIVLDDGAQK